MCMYVCVLKKALFKTSSTLPSFQLSHPNVSCTYFCLGTLEVTKEFKKLLKSLNAESF